MNRVASRFVRLSVALLGLVTLAWVLTGSAAKPAVHQRVSLVTDWSHAHVVFSHPATAKLARQVQEDPRYWQQIQRQIPRVLPPQVSLGGLAPISASSPRARHRPRMHRDWSENLGLLGAPLPAGNFPAKFSFDSITASCTDDYVVFSTGLPGAAGPGGQASIVAFNNLYTGCGGTVPSVLWAYRTAAVPARILTSPALSLDGTQIAFVQTTGPSAQLVLLKWIANPLLSVTSPGTPTIVAANAYRTCSAPCMATFNLTDRSGLIPSDDRTSSVFIDYSGDQAWVGDGAGLLHKFVNVFRAPTPAEVQDTTWPVQVSAAALSSAVLDHASGNVFAGDRNGFLFRVDRNTGAVTGSGQLDRGVGIVAGPVVDSGNLTVYVSASNDGSEACLNGIVPVDCAAVYRLATNFGSGDTGSKVVVGISTDHIVGPPNPMFDGFFDSSYLNSPDGTGNYYVCGNTGAAPILYQVPVAPSPAFGAPVDVAALAPPNSSPACSPVTDISNPNSAHGTAERVFVSVQNSGQVCNSANGCVMNFVVTPWQPSTAYNLGQQVLVRALGNPDVLFIQVAIHAGTSGTTTPAWGFGPDVVIGDPDLTPTSVGWLNQGRVDDVPYASWTPNTLFGLVGQRILDSNGNIQLVHVAGTSGATPPTWSVALNNTTADGSDTLLWRNSGPPASFSIPAAGGTSGIIIDNTFDIGVIAGTSQIYFSTLADQDCAFLGDTGSCAVQASQPTLQ